MKNWKNMILSAAVTAAVAIPAFDAEARPSRAANGAKYVFFFLGDGMASVNMQAAEAYMTHLNGGDADNAADLLNSDNILFMNKLPVQGMSTTFADTRFITGSAAAATAFACGAKTSIRTIGRDSSKTNLNYKSVAELAHEQGKSVGIISSVSLPHATPAGYYANVADRGDYCEIGYQASQSGFEFFGGGRFRKLDKTDNQAGVVLSNAFINAGYKTVNTIADALNEPLSQKVICSVPTSYDSDAMPYAIDRPAENFSLAEVTACAIQRLQNDPQGFFIMVEGGKIDWAGHANDAVANLEDMIAFDEAVAEAIAFYNAHPRETLIVVTGDHETGGMVLGYVGNKYGTDFSVLEGQIKSYDRFIAEDLAPYKTTYYANASITDPAAQWDAEAMNIDQDLKVLIEANFGLVWTNLAAAQQEELEAAFDRTMSGVKADARFSGYDLDGVTDVDYVTYGGYEPFTITLCHMMNKEAGIVWTSTSHTGVPVPVLAAGFDAWRFNGFYDNTDIAKKIVKAMRLPVALPVSEPNTNTQY